MTSIRYALPEAQMVRLDVVDIFGRTVATLVNGKQSPGDHVVTFDARALVSGTYFSVLRGEKAHDVRPMLLVK